MILSLIRQAQDAGVRLQAACRVVGLPPRTIQRWRNNPDGEDGRHGAHHKQSNALRTSEEAQILEVMLSERYRGVPIKQLVPMLADEKLYLASESTFYRLARRRGLRRTPRETKRTYANRANRMHCATGPNQVWSWDITWLPTNVRGRFFYLYMVMDVWSRRIVGRTIAETESPDISAALVADICRETGIDPCGLVLHADNGNAMRGNTMIATLQKLGIIPSFSRPHVSDDNPYSESLFRTLKHTPAYPRRVFASMAAASAWVTAFVDWYNGTHRHSGIRFVTPNERHDGREHAILARRHELYQRAKRANPERWSRNTRNWSPVGEVLLNPEPNAAGEAIAAAS
jgi:putative transposase